MDLHKYCVFDSLAKMSTYFLLTRIPNKTGNVKNCFHCYLKDICCIFFHSVKLFSKLILMELYSPTFQCENVKGIISDLAPNGKRQWSCLETGVRVKYQTSLKAWSTSSGWLLSTRVGRASPVSLVTPSLQRTETVSVDFVTSIIHFSLFLPYCSSINFNNPYGGILFKTHFIIRVKNHQIYV